MDQENTYTFHDLVDKNILEQIQDSYSQKHDVGLCLYDNNKNVVTHRNISFPALQQLDDNQQNYFHILYSIDKIDTQFSFVDRQPLYQRFLDGFVHRAVFPIYFKDNRLGFAILIQVARPVDPDKDAECLGSLKKALTDGSGPDALRDQAKPAAPDELRFLVEEFESLLELLFEAGYERKKYSQSEESHESDAGKTQDGTETILFCTTDGDVLDTTPNAPELFEYKDVQSLVGSNITSDFIQDDQHKKNVDQVIKSGSEMDWCSLTLRNKQGQLLAGELKLTPQKEIDKVIGYECRIKIKPNEPIKETSEDQSALGVIANHMLQEEEPSMDELMTNFDESEPKIDNEQTNNYSDGLLSVEGKGTSGQFSYSSKGVAQLLDTIPDPFVVIDEQNKVRIWNKAVERLLGIPALSIVDSEFDTLIASDMQEQWQNWLSELLKGEKDELRPETSLSLIDNNASIVEADVYLSLNIILGRQYITVMLRTKKKESTSEKRVFEFQKESPAPQMGADYSSLLDEITGQYDKISKYILRHTSSMEISGSLNRKQRSNLKELNRLGNLFSEMNFKLALYSGQDKPNLQPIDPNELLKKLSGRLEKYLPSHIEYIVNLDDELPLIHADQMQFIHAIGVLCKNAVEAMPGSGTLRIETFAEDDNVRVTVSDTGRGIDKNIQQNLFQPFTSTKKGIGHGLGLVSVKGMMEAHNGSIDIQTFERGTKISLIFPAVYQSTIENQDSRAESYSAKGSILIIDDDEGIAETSATALNQQGYFAIANNSGETGLTMLKMHRNEIDLVVLDVRLQNCTGLECARDMLKINKNIPIIFTSGAQPGEELSNFMDQHHCGWLSKPYTMDSLVKIVKNYLEF